MNTLLHFSVNQQFISQMSTLTLVFQQQFLGQGFVKGEEFRWSYPDYFSK